MGNCEDSNHKQLYHDRDKNKNNGLETKFLLDTGASSSIINYHTYLELCKLQHIEMKASKIIL